ncbi:hypothetical protein BD289DRAFT_115958 [Coniella lustricola]|uniref:Uncharacterized protein n=1 Tax=Coniella lustricola TaxID=2025994 RepID=A0A2T2ZWZ9_9PEZI|nr:hypothetical protein BD289DRAFT_115958 [Coniella lustricola]
MAALPTTLHRPAHAGDGAGYEAIHGLREQIHENSQFLSPSTSTTSSSPSLSLIVTRESEGGYKAIVLLTQNSTSREPLLVSESFETPVLALEGLLVCSADAVRDWISVNGFGYGNKSVEGGGGGCGCCGGKGDGCGLEHAASPEALLLEEPSGSTSGGRGGAAATGEHFQNQAHLQRQPQPQPPSQPQQPPQPQSQGQTPTTVASTQASQPSVSATPSTAPQQTNFSSAVSVKSTPTTEAGTSSYNPTPTSPPPASSPHASCPRPATTATALPTAGKIEYRLIIRLQHMGSQKARFHHHDSTVSGSDDTIHTLADPRCGGSGSECSVSNIVATPESPEYHVLAYGVASRAEMHSVALRYISEVYDLALTPFELASKSTLASRSLGGADARTCKTGCSLSSSSDAYGKSTLSVATPYTPAPASVPSTANTTGPTSSRSYIRTIVSRVTFMVDDVGRQEAYDLASCTENDFGPYCEEMAARLALLGRGDEGAERTWRRRDGPWMLPLFEVVCTRFWV